FICLLSTFFFLGCNQPQPDATLQKRLVGTWRYHESSGTAVKIRSDLVFTVTSSGGYFFTANPPPTPPPRGQGQGRNGLLIITVTNVDNATLSSPLVDRQTIVRFDNEELVIRSEGSTVEDVFRRDTQ